MPQLDQINPKVSTPLFTT